MTDVPNSGDIWLKKKAQPSSQPLAMASQPSSSQSQRSTKTSWASRALGGIGQQQTGAGRHFQNHQRIDLNGGDSVDKASTSSTGIQPSSSWTTVSSQKRNRNIQHPHHHRNFNNKKGHDLHRKGPKQNKSGQKHKSADGKKSTMPLSSANDNQTAAVASRQIKKSSSPQRKQKQKQVKSITITSWAHHGQEFPPLVSSSNTPLQGVKNHARTKPSPSGLVASSGTIDNDTKTNIHAKVSPNMYKPSTRQYPSLSQSYSMTMSHNTSNSRPTSNVNPYPTVQNRNALPLTQKKNTTASPKKETFPQANHAVPSNTGRKRHLPTSKMNIMTTKTSSECGGDHKKNKKIQKKNAIIKPSAKIQSRLQRSENHPETFFPLPSNQRLLNSHHVENMLSMPEHFLIHKKTDDGLVKKGKQKIRRKKILSPLKKKILKERLEQWRTSQGLHADGTPVFPNRGETHEEDDGDHDDRNIKHDLSTVVVLDGYVQPDELEDEEEYNEILHDLHLLAEKITVVDIAVYIPRAPYMPPTLDNPKEISTDQNENHEGSCLAFVKFGTAEYAMAASACWNGMVLGGNRLIVKTISRSLWEQYELEDEKMGKEGEKCWTDIVNQIPHNMLVMSLTQVKIELAGGTSRDDHHCKAESLSQSCSIGNNDNKCLVILSNILSEDDFDDEECMMETMQDLQNLLAEYGPINVQHGLRVNHTSQEVYVTYEHPSDAYSAVQKMEGTILGGMPIHATLDHDLTFSERGHVICLENILTEDDFEDEECLQAAREDIFTLAKKCGRVIGNIHIQEQEVNFGIDGKGGVTKRGEVYIVYENEAAARKALNHFSSMVIGGMTVRARLDTQYQHFLSHSSNTHSTSNTQSASLVLENILTEDDYDDDECLEETKSDLEKMLRKFGEVESMDIVLNGCNKGQVSIIFAGGNSQAVAFEACSDLDGSLLGGSNIFAKVVDNTGAILDLQAGACADGKEGIGRSAVPRVTAGHDIKLDVVPASGSHAPPQPMYSGNKIIPEQYAECKRAPKIPNAGVPREYAKRIDDESVVPLLFEMLGELMRLQLRAKANVATSKKVAKRRLVMGLREVSRGIRANKVKMVIMANNLDQYGALDEKLQDILFLAKEHDLPVIFELNKRKLGKALGKTIKVSVVGVESSDGAYEPFKKLKKLCGVI